MLQRGLSASRLQGVQEERVRQGVALFSQDALQVPHCNRRAVQRIKRLPQHTTSCSRTFHMSRISYVLSRTRCVPQCALVKTITPQPGQGVMALIPQ